MPTGGQNANKHWRISDLPRDGVLMLSTARAARFQTPDRAKDGFQACAVAPQGAAPGRIRSTEVDAGRRAPPCGRTRRAQGRTCPGTGGVERAELERRLSALR
jgi:hypothetical protein